MQLESEGAKEGTAGREKESESVSRLRVTSRHSLVL